MTDPARAPIPRIVVIGGGISGLATAHALRGRAAGIRRMVEIVLLEAAGRTGGNIRSELLSGFLCEWGPNGFLDNAPATRLLIEELGLQGRVQVSDDSARRRFIYRNGRLRLVPDGVLAFVRSDLLSWPGKLRIALEPVARSRSNDAETIHEFASRRIGREAADILIASMVSGIFAGDSRKLSLEACFPRMRRMEDEHGGLFRALLAARRRKRRGEGADGLAPVPGATVAGGTGRGGEPRSAPPAMGMPSGRLTSFRGGMEELVRALTDSLGAIVRTGSRVSSLTSAVADTGAQRRYRVGVEGGTPLEADAVLLSGPARESSRIVSGLDPDLADLLGSVESAPLVVVCLGFEAALLPAPLDGFGLLVPPGEGPRILGVLWDSSIYPGRAPEGKVLIRAMIGGARDPQAIELSDAALLEIVLTDVAATMGVRSAPIFVKIFRHPLGIPQYTVGHLKRLRALDGRLRLHPGLALAGNSYKGVSINSCIEEAAPVALRLLEAACPSEFLGRMGTHGTVLR